MDKFFTQSDRSQYLQSQNILSNVFLEKQEKSKIKFNISLEDIIVYKNKEIQPAILIEIPNRTPCAIEIIDGNSIKQEIIDKIAAYNNIGYNVHWFITVNQLVKNKYPERSTNSFR